MQWCGSLCSSLIRKTVLLGTPSRTWFCHKKSTSAIAMAEPSSAPSYRSNRQLKYGQMHVVEPRGEHKATIVWLHGLGDVGASWAGSLEMLPLQHIKWVCPTAPVQPVAFFGGFPCNSWFNVGSLSEDMPDDLEGMDASARHVADLLMNEPSHIKLGIGGFSQGAATALYTMTCSIARKYSDGTDFPCKLSVAVALSGWLPCAKMLRTRIVKDAQAVEKAKDMPVLFAHGTADNIVLYKFGRKSAEVLESAGFGNVSFKTYARLGHSSSPEEMNDICTFLRNNLQLQS